jgi:hypothetical protein
MTAIALPDAWSACVDAVIGDLLDRAGWRAPPVDALSLAERVGVDVAFDAAQENRGRFVRLPGRAAILLRPEERPERLQWAAAHELGEMHIARIAEESPDAGDLAPEVREALANRFAARLLLPECSFPEDAERRNGNVPALKAIYTTASHELVALRMLDFDVPTVITVFDHGRPTRRRSNLPAGTPSLQPVEQRAQGDAHILGLPVDLTHGSLRVQAWPIHEPGWKREILRATLAQTDDV